MTLSHLMNHVSAVRYATYLALIWNLAIDGWLKRGIWGVAGNGCQRPELVPESLHKERNSSRS